MKVISEHGTLARGYVGTRFTDGFDVLFLGGTNNAQIISVRSVGGEDSLEFLGAMLAGPQRKQAGWSQLKGYPPHNAALGPLVEAEGAVIEPREQTQRRLGYELLLGYEVVRDSEVASRSQIEVTYRIGDQDYVWTSLARLVYCPAREKSEDCFDEAERNSYG